MDCFIAKFLAMTRQFYTQDHTMKIAIMSDSHEHWDNLRHAISTANNGCEVLLFAGDLMSSGEGLAALKTFNGSVHMVF